MLQCKYCGKQCKNKNSLVQHEIRCKENPNRISIQGGFIQYNEYRRENGIKGENQYTKAKQLNLDKPEISEKTKENFCKYWLNKKLPDDMKNNISKGMKLAVELYPDSYNSSNVNGRVKKIKYNDILLDSSWEVIVAQYLDSNNIKWIKPKNGFKYLWEGKEHIYYPDFYLPEYDRYIEVKGFERERDKVKYACINDLIIIKQEEITKITNNEYTIKL